MSPNSCLEVTGPFDCFTHPEMKVERVSYDLMTPSAARAILWKPAIRWRVHRIEVLKPNAPAHALFDRLQVKAKEEGAVARSFDAYSVLFDGQGLSVG